MSKAYCKKCNTNWAELREVWPDDNFEFHEVCPKCITELWLEPAKEGAALTPYKPFEPYANILKDVKLPLVPQNSKEAIDAYKQMENKKSTLNY